MAYYLVDIENVGDSGFEGFAKLTNNDVVFVVYRYDTQLSKRAKRIINEAKFEVKLLQVDETTKNAADFAIVAYLGTLVASNKTNEYYVVTRDKGFQPAISLLVKLYPHVKIEIKSNISSPFLAITKKSRRLMIEEKLKPLETMFDTKDDFDKIVNICAKSEDLNELNNKVKHSFKKGVSSEIYDKVKPIYRDITRNIV